MNTEMKRMVDHFGNQRKVADVLGCTPEHVHQMLTKKREMSVPMVRRIKAAWPGVNLHALLEVPE